MAPKQLEAARRLAAATPSDRNRYADFLRAVAILAVVIGHWLMAAVWIDGAGHHTENVLGIIPELQWLTWALQVMPIFFLVGGYSNWLSWSRAPASYGDWLRKRLRRLVTPTIALIAVWGGITLIGTRFGLDHDLARIGSQTALIPLWFLAVYVLMVAATPLSVAVWKRFGLRAAVLLALGALGTDAARAVFEAPGIGFANYLFVWGPIYLLGHAWASGGFATPTRAPLLGVTGLLLLIAMTVVGPYHISMVGVPGVEFGNTAPPSAALLALGLAQIGIALSIERPMRAWLERPAVWTGTVLINGSIMTIYVWHMTAMALMIGGLLLVDSPLLAIAPGTGLWWLSRPAWLALLGVATLPFLAVFGRFERPRREPATERSTLGALATALSICASYTSVAVKGLTPQHPLWAAIALVPLVPIWLWLRAGSSAKVPV